VTFRQRIPLHSKNDPECRVLCWPTVHMSSSEGEPEHEERDEEPEEEPTTFEALGLSEPICEACKKMGYKAPSSIQREAVPWGLQGRDLIGLAETGSGKTAAFALPILHRLLERPQPLFGLVVSPTRELAFQIGEQFEALGSVMGVKCAVAVGGVDLHKPTVDPATEPVFVQRPRRLRGRRLGRRLGLRRVDRVVVPGAELLGSPAVPHKYPRKNAHRSAVVLTGEYAESDGAPGHLLRHCRPRPRPCPRLPVQTWRRRAQVRQDLLTEHRVDGVLFPLVVCLLASQQ